MAYWYTCGNSASKQTTTKYVTRQITKMLESENPDELPLRDALKNRKYVGLDNGQAKPFLTFSELLLFNNYLPQKIRDQINANNNKLRQHFESGSAALIEAAKRNRMNTGLVSVAARSELVANGEMQIEANGSMQVEADVPSAVVPTGVVPTLVPDNVEIGAQLPLKRTAYEKESIEVMEARTAMFQAQAQVEEAGAKREEAGAKREEAGSKRECQRFEFFMQLATRGLVDRQNIDRIVASLS